MWQKCPICDGEGRVTRNSVHQVCSVCNGTKIISQLNGLPSNSIDKEQQKKLLIELMELDEKDGLYETNNMKLYTREQMIEAFNYGQNPKGFDWIGDMIDSLTPIELPSDEEIIGRFMNWFLKHYSTATINGFFGYVNSLEEEVTIREILDDYFNKEQILNQNK